jgi:hypothetical protein
MQGLQMSDFLSTYPNLLDDFWYRPSDRPGREPDMMITPRLHHLYWRWRDLMEEIIEEIQEENHC